MIREKRGITLPKFGKYSLRATIPTVLSFYQEIHKLTLLRRPLFVLETVIHLNEPLVVRSIKISEKRAEKPFCFLLVVAF